MFSNVQSTLTGTGNPYRKSVVFSSSRRIPSFFFYQRNYGKAGKAHWIYFLAAQQNRWMLVWDFKSHVCVCVCVQTVKENGVSGSDRLILRFMPLSVKFPSASKVHPGSLLSSSLSLWFSFILPSSYLFSFLSFFLSFYVLLSFLCSVIHSIRRINTIFSPSIVCFRLFIRQIIQSFYWKQQKHLFFYFGTRPLEIFTHPTKIQMKDHPPPPSPSVSIPSGCTTTIHTDMGPAFRCSRTKGKVTGRSFQCWSDEFNGFPLDSFDVLFRQLLTCCLSTVRLLECFSWSSILSEHRDLRRVGYGGYGGYTVGGIRWVTDADKDDRPSGQ